MLSSAYLGNDPENVEDFEAWLGTEVDFVRAHTGKANWSDYLSSVEWVGDRMAETGHPLVWTIPMFAENGSLEAAAEGRYDEDHASVATSILEVSGAQDEIVVRFGEEFNGWWFPWAAEGRPDTYVDAFRNMVDTFRSVSDKFTFEWNVNIGERMDPATAYPGDDYVDIISMDFYYNTDWHDTDASAAWNNLVTMRWGLQWFEDFAASRGKPTAYSEWGVSHDGAGPFIAEAFDWFAEHDVVYQSYWNSNADFPGALDTGSRPNAAAEYRAQMLEAAEANETGEQPPAPTQEESRDPAPTEPEPDPSDTPSDEAPQEAPQEDPALRTEAPDLSGSVRTWDNGSWRDDSMTGDDRNNYLNGRNGTDTTAGGRGDDLHVVERAADVVVEKAGEGIDTVHSWATSYVLPEHVENLELLKASGITGIGNDLANWITARDGDDTLDGAGGADWLTGGAGADEFRFSAGGGRDTITDFGDGGDVLRLDGTEIDSFADLIENAVEMDGDTAVLLGDTDSVMLLGVSVENLSAEDFVFA